MRHKKYEQMFQEIKFSISKWEDNFKKDFETEKSCLGYKVFDITQMNDHAKTFNQGSKEFCQTNSRINQKASIQTSA